MSTFKKIWNVASTVLVVLLVLCALFLMGSRFIGYQCFTILSGSMEPAYSLGDLIYTKQVYTKNIANIEDKDERNAAIQEKIAKVEALVEDGTLQVGDPITFVMESLAVATHRIVEIDQENHVFYTKGDANESVDTPVVRYENLIGEVHFSIPKLGHLANFIQNPPGTYYTVAAGIVLILLVFVPDMLGKKEQEEDTADPEVAAVQAERNAAAEENERLKAELEKLRSEISEKVPQAPEKEEETQ